MKSNVTVKHLKEFFKKYEFSDMEINSNGNCIYLNFVDSNMLISDIPVHNSVYVDYKNCVRLFAMKNNRAETVYVSDKFFAVHNYSDEINAQLNLNYQKYMTKYVEGYADYIMDAYTDHINKFKNEIYRVNGEIKESNDEFFRDVQKQKVRAYEKDLKAMENNKKSLEEFIKKNSGKIRQL